MPKLPPLITPTLAAIHKSLEADQTNWESVGISAGEISMECERALWFTFRRASVKERIGWKQKRIFERGNIEEERLLALLRIAGVEVWGEQDRVRAAGGHLRGKIDGRGLGLLEAPKTEHVIECKSAKDEIFQKVKKSGVRIGKPDHYATMQFYMHGLGLTRTGYIMSNKNDEDVHFERVHYDAEFAIRLVARVERIINMPEPPARLCRKRDDPTGMFCKHAGVCWGEEMPRSHCRTCIHSTPLMDGKAGWDCARWNMPIGYEKQAEGCEAHLFIPSIFSDRVKIAVDRHAETVSYRLNNGKIWVDGKDK